MKTSGLNRQHGKGEVFDHERRHIRLMLLEPDSINSIAMQIPRRLGGQIKLPLRQKGIANLREQAPPHVLAEDAAVLVGRIKVLTYPRRQVVLSSVCPDAHDAFSAMRLLTLLEQNIETVLRNLRQILPGKTGEALKNIVQVLAGLRHATWLPSHCSCFPKPSPFIGTA
jgi:hypothetical protein